MRLHWQRVTPNEWRAGDYMIIRWYANDRGNRVRQYQAEYYPETIPMDALREVLDDGRPLDDAPWQRVSIPLHREPFRELADAKAACQQHADWLERDAQDVPGVEQETEAI